MLLYTSMILYLLFNFCLYYMCAQSMFRQNLRYLKLHLRSCAVFAQDHILLGTFRIDNVNMSIHISLISRIPLDVCQSGSLNFAQKSIGLSFLDLMAHLLAMYGSCKSQLSTRLLILPVVISSFPPPFVLLSLLSLLSLTLTTASPVLVHSPIPPQLQVSDNSTEYQSQKFLKPNRHPKAKSNMELTDQDWRIYIQGMVGLRGIIREVQYARVMVLMGPVLKDLHSPPEPFGRVCLSSIEKVINNLYGCSFPT